MPRRGALVNRILLHGRVLGPTVAEANREHNERRKERSHDTLVCELCQRGLEASLGDSVHVVRDFTRNPTANFSTSTQRRRRGSKSRKLSRRNTQTKHSQDSHWKSQET